jgi:threonine dehydrogenase-like Zn-dependent dehydrogenase
MRAVVYREPGRIEVGEVPRPELVDDTDAIVRVQLSGICGTDLHVMRGDFSGMQPGMVVGHEFVGEVVEVGVAVKRFRLKDIVMSADFTACGRCRWCDEGDHWHCGERAFFGTGTAYGPALAGGQAEYVRVPHADTTLGELPAGCSPEAGLLMADNLATGWISVERAAVGVGDCVVVIGGGTVGQLTALSAQAMAAGVVIVVEPAEGRRAFARSQGSLAVHPDEAPEVVKRLTGGIGADAVIEAVGSNLALDLALTLVRPRGRVVSVGAHTAEKWSFPVAKVFASELNLGFAIGNAIRLRGRLFRLLASGAFDPTVVIDGRGRLEDAPRLYAELDAQRLLKAVMNF